MDWIYECRYCGAKFKNAELADTVALSFPRSLKVNFPPETIDMECPACGYEGSYAISALVRSVSNSETA